jgi:hypothetical protein
VWVDRLHRGHPAAHERQVGGGLRGRLHGPGAAREAQGDRGGRPRRKKSGDEQHVADTDAAKEARRAAELVDVDAAEARERVGQLSGDSQLDRAEKAERELGKARTTVLEAIERRRDHS